MTPTPHQNRMQRLIAKAAAFHVGDRVVIVEDDRPGIVIEVQTWRVRVRPVGAARSIRFNADQIRKVAADANRNPRPD